MQRSPVPIRRDWRQRVEALGFEFHTLDGPYWVEDACYRFDQVEIDRLESAGNELHAMCLDAVADIVRTGDYARLGLGPIAATLAERAWRAGEQALYGRMDLAYDGTAPPKLLEYNADTPTALFEAAVVQWYWLEDTRAGLDQFNLLHEALVRRWPALIPEGSCVHFAGSLEAVEDRVTTDYLRDTCTQAGFATTLLDMSDIGWKDGQFVDLDDHPIRALFKLYPWEWMVEEPFARHLPDLALRIVEPAWKQLLSNKSLLPLLWERHRGHPNLLAASHDPRDIEGRVVAKPRFGREGEGVRVSDPDRGMHFAEPGMVYQAHAPLYRSEAGYGLVGLWVVGDEAVGLGMREDANPVTGNASRFVPHCFG